MQANEANSAASDLDLAVNDLGPLAWVLDELRKSLDGATKALRRFVRDADMARGSDLGTVDASHLRIARQQLHQAVGALEMVGLGAPAHVLRAMETAVQLFVQRPELCSDEAAAKMERCSFALTEYLQGVLVGKPVSSVALFPQYREVQELAGADRIHPADLWQLEWRWLDLEVPGDQAPHAYDAPVRAQFDQAILSLIKSSDVGAATELRDISLGFSAAQSARQPRTFWKIAAAYFDALRLGLLPVDVFVKRAASRTLLQYATLARGDQGVSDRLAQDLLFFCAQAAPANPGDAPVLSAVRSAYALGRFKPVAYQTSQFVRFDPVLLAQARKRIGAAKDTWSALSGGDVNKLKGVSDQFSLVSDSLIKLYPPSEPLAQTLARTIESTVHSGQPPSAELAMEVATSVLYLEAAFEDLDPNDPQLEERTSRLAQRLEHVRTGGQSEALETWMEDLYRRVSDRQTMGSVVGELRTSLGELEKSLDQFFRNPADKTSLRDVPGQLAQMRGVLSVLGLEQASMAVLKMRDRIEEILVTEVDEERARAAGTFDNLGNNLGALGFLIDMLNYQPALAKKLFVYDEALGELKPLMGRIGDSHGSHHGAEAAGTDALSLEARSVVGDAGRAQADGSLTVRLDTLAEHAALADQPGLARSARDASAALAGKDSAASTDAMSQLAATVAPVPMPVAGGSTAAADDVEEDDLRDIFLEEAREVVQNGLVAIAELAAEPADVGQQTTLRRAFHTLKGSSRMVGLTEFGEAAWSMEQVLNAWLAEQKPMSAELRTLSAEAMHGFGRWVEDIAQNRDSEWKASMFKASAEPMRLESRLVPLQLPTGEASPGIELEFELPVEAPAAAPAAAAAPVDLDFGFELPAEPAASASAPVEVPTPVPDAVEIEGIDFDSLAALASGASEGDSSEPRRAEHAPDEPPTNSELDALFDAVAAEPAAPAPVADAAPAPDFSFELASGQEAEISPVAGLAAETAVPREAAAEHPVSGAAPTDGVMEAFDLGAFDVPAAPETPQATEEFPVDESTGSPDEQVKVIGDLRIGIPLYNVYLNEADEWSRRLSQELGEWAIEWHRHVPDSTVGLAHSLAGSSGTVGFHALSEMARALEHALQHVGVTGGGTAQQAKAFVDAAEDIRRLLHQFAAGFLKEPDRAVLAALRALDHVGTASAAVAPVAIAEPAVDVVAAAPAVEAIEYVSAFEFPEPVPEPEPAAPAVLAEDPPLAAVPHVAAPVVLQPVPQFDTRPAGQAATRSEDDQEFDVVDVVDPDLFPIFEDEANELLPQLGGALRQWASRPDNQGARVEVLRALHTLKGSARLAGALRMGELTHRLESEIEELGSEGVPASAIEPLLARFDAVQANFDALRQQDAAAMAPATVEAPAPAAAPIVAPAAATLPQETPVAADASKAAPARSLIPAQSSTLAPVRQAAAQLVRVRTNLLDRLVNQAGEVMITRTRLEAELGQLRGSLGDLTGNLDRLRQQLRDIELQAETQMQSRLAQAKEAALGFDPLEFDRFTRVQELTRMMAESVNDVATVQRSLQRTVEATEDDLIAQARQTRELQRDLLRTRMVEFEGISDRLYRVVRQASKDSGKQVKLDITGGSIEMDRGVLDRMTPAFEHLLRNCVAHGIEDPAVRVAAGKEATGLITIGLHQEGNDVSVAFRDDGAGLDLVRIRDKAVAQGLLAPGQELTNADAANLVFMPGFSTATQVTELSGRGIGMDVVRSEVNALGGRIETVTETGKGTSFRLVLPLTTAVTQVVMLRTGKLSIGVPANVVEIVRRATPKELQQAYNSGTFEIGGETVPFFWSGALLQASQRSDEPLGKTAPVVIFRSAAQRLAVHVDEVLGNQEVVVKNLGPQLSRLPGLAGMTVLASGAVAMIYNPVALATVYGDQARRLSADHAQADVLGQAGGTAAATMEPVAPQIPLVLVVDDSITVRRVTQRLLQREGYRVALAVDGLQALERLQEEIPAVVLSDIEMPRMDGFDLARNIRGDARLKDLPIIMITSRIAEKHREHAMELGVNHYLGKPYSEEELLSLVRRYTTAEISA